MACFHYFPDTLLHLHLRTMVIRNLLTKGAPPWQPWLQSLEPPSSNPVYALHAINDQSSCRLHSFLLCLQDCQCTCEVTMVRAFDHPSHLEMHWIHGDRCALLRWQDYEGGRLQGIGGSASGLWLRWDTMRQNNTDHGGCWSEFPNILCVFFRFLCAGHLRSFWIYIDRELKKIA